MSDIRSYDPAISRSPESQEASVASPQVERRLRIWPGVVLIAILWLLLTVPARLVPNEMIVLFYSVFFGPIVITALLVVWWLFFSRLRRTDRLLGLFAFAAIGAATYLFWDPSLTGDDSKGVFSLVIYALPVVTTAWVGWLVLTPFLGWSVRRVGLLVVFALAWGVFTLVRYEGVWGDFSATFKYRWSLTEEEKYLAKRAAEKGNTAPKVDSAAPPAALETSDWPGFRGPNRDGRLTGVRIPTDWQQHPPRELWRQRIGPGWSSFAVVGDRLYTQEQRGKDEAVVCLDAGTGKDLWAHEDAARFSEALGGVGPRATPTYYDGKIYALGATGRLNCLDAASGEVKWSHDIVADSGAKVPMWGFASSPLVAEGVVLVFAGGPDGKSVLGYNVSSGDLLWSAGEGQNSYCSLQPAHLDGADQAPIATEKGLTSFQPTNGQILWQHDWPLEGMTRVVQPTLVGDSDVLLGTGFGIGTRRVHVGSKADKWPTTELWTTRAINPYYNDLVVHRGHLYGFDGNFFTCVNLEDGQGKWRARGYGNGQVLLLADQDLLLVLSEKGEVALLEANPDRHQVVGRFEALHDKTWNHPVVAHGKLFVRNGVEVACYELAGEDGKGSDGK